MGRPPLIGIGRMFAAGEGNFAPGSGLTRVPGDGPHFPWGPLGSDFYHLGQRQCIINVDPEVGLIVLAMGIRYALTGYKALMAG